MQHLPAEVILPGMGGHAYRKIAKALGQDPDLTKR